MSVIESTKTNQVDKGALNLTELIPVGGLRRVNLSNLRQASGRDQTVQRFTSLRDAEEAR
jgi:hypothetical protein